MTVFGQVNLSLDGVGAAATVFRSAADPDAVDRAFTHLLAAGVSTGINCVVGRGNFESLPELFAYAERKGLSEVELLRFKPSGRGRASYRAKRMTGRQGRHFLPLVRDLAEKHGITAKIDCSFLPMLCYHRPPRELLERLGVCGCEAGNYLAGVRSDGRVSGCSFLPPLDMRVRDLPEVWENDAGLRSLRQWHLRAPEPCASCSYLDLCRGGCRAVALAETGNTDEPDPGCPRVADLRAGEDRT
jgi:radical SAM protein with 4Fe4S-binding SPASM domain